MSFQENKLWVADINVHSKKFYREKTFPGKLEVKVYKNFLASDFVLGFYELVSFKAYEKEWKEVPVYEDVEVEDENSYDLLNPRYTTESRVSHYDFQEVNVAYTESEVTYKKELNLFDSLSKRGHEFPLVSLENPKWSELIKFLELENIERPLRLVKKGDYRVNFNVYVPPSLHRSSYFLSRLFKRGRFDHRLEVWATNPLSTKGNFQTKRIIVR